ncbi:Ig-like domain repeat protein, partial [Rodentibacter myodis]
INNGYTTVDVPVAGDGDITVTAKVTDPAGNSSATGDKTVTVDTKTPGDSNGDGVVDGNDDSSNNVKLPNGQEVPRNTNGAPNIVFGEDANGDGKLNGTEITGKDGVDKTPVYITIPDNTEVGDSLIVTINGEPTTIPVTQEMINNGYTTVDVPVAGDGDITVTAKVTDPAGNSSATGEQTITVDTTPPASPTITVNNEGSATVDLPDDADKVTVTVPQENGPDKEVVLTKDPNGNWTSSDPSVIPNPENGKGNVTIPKENIKQGGEITAKAKDEAGNSTTDTADLADKPTIASPNNDGKVTVTPGNDNNKVEVKIPTEPDGQEKTITAEKDADGNWKMTNDNGSGATIDPDTGVITILADKVKDGEPINATGTNPEGNKANADIVNAGTDPVTPPSTPRIPGDVDNDGDVDDSDDDETTENGAPKLTIPEAEDGVINKVEAESDNGVPAEVTLPKNTLAGDKVTLTVTTPDGTSKSITHEVTQPEETAKKVTVTIPTADVAKDGDYKVTAKVTTPEGQSSKESTEVPFKVDQTEPTISVKISGAEDGIISAAEKEAGVTAEVTLPKTAKAGDLVEVVLYKANGNPIIVKGLVKDTSGKLSIPLNKDDLVDGVSYQVEAKHYNGPNDPKNLTSTSEKQSFDVDLKADKPNVDPQPNGSVTIEPGNDNVHIELKFNDENETPKTVIAERKESGWEITDADGTTVSIKDGKIVIPAAQVKDESTVKANAKDKAGNTNSDDDEARDNPEPVPPKITTQVMDNLSDETTGADAILQALDKNDPTLPTYKGVVGSNGLTIDTSSEEKLQLIKSLSDGLTNDNAHDVSFTLDAALDPAYTIKFYRVQVEQQMIDKLDSDGNAVKDEKGNVVKELQEATFNRVEMGATKSADGLAYTLDADDLPETYGTQYRYIAEVTDSKGNVVQTARQDIYLDTMVDSMEVTSTTAGQQSGAIAAMTFSMNGRSEVGATIRITYKDMTKTEHTVTATANNDGTYSVDFSKTGALNRYNTDGMQVEVIDAAGNISTSKTMMMRNLFSDMTLETGPDPSDVSRFNIANIALSASPQISNENGFLFTDGNDHLIVGLDEYKDTTVNGNMASMILGGARTFATGAGDDHIQLRGNLQTWRGGRLDMGEGNDKLTFNTAEIGTGGPYNIDMGDGNNQIIINGAVNRGATIVATFGSGNDSVISKSNLDGSGSSNYNFGDGDNRLEVGGYITQAQTFAFGSGNDVVQVNSNIDYATLTLGEGNNLVQMGGYLHYGATVTAGGGDDVFVANQLRGSGSTNVNLGGGDDSFTVDTLARAFGKVELGEGNDTATVRLADGGTLDMGAGDDTVNIVTLSYTGVELGEGNDTITISDDLNGSSYLDGGEGTDTLYLTKAGGDYSMSYIRNVETIDLTATGRQNLDVKLDHLTQKDDAISRILIKGTSEDTVDLGANNSFNDSGNANMNDNSNGLVGGNLGTWAKAKQDVVDGITYDVYTYSSGSQGPSDQLVYVQQGVQVL